MKLGWRFVVGCGCSKTRRPNVNDPNNLRAVTAPSQRYAWQVGSQTFDLLQDAKEYADANGLTVSRKLI